MFGVIGGTLLAGGWQGASNFTIMNIALTAILWRKFSKAWNPTQGPRIVRPLVRFYLSSFLIVLTSLVLLPGLLRGGTMTVDTLVLVHPLFLAAIESVFVHLVLSDKFLLDWHDEHISLLCRHTIAFLESSRVAVLLSLAEVSHNPTSSLILALGTNIALSVLSRNHIPGIIFGIISGQPRESWSTMERSQRVMIGCQTDTEYFPLYFLVIVRLTSYAGAAGRECDGSVTPVLLPTITTICIMLSGELLSDVSAALLGRAMTRYFPDLSVSAPVVGVGRRGQLLHDTIVYLGVLAICWLSFVSTIHVSVAGKEYAAADEEEGGGGGSSM